MDNTPPVITCPSNIRQEVTSGDLNGAIVIWEPATATDDSGMVTVTPTIITQPTPGSFLPFSSYVISYTARDGASNSVSCVFTVEVGKDPLSLKILCYNWAHYNREHTSCCFVLFLMCVDLSLWRIVVGPEKRETSHLLHLY